MTPGEDSERGDRRAMTTSFPVAALAGLGVLIAVLGLFVAGNVTLMIIGLAAIAVAGVIEVFLRRSG